MSYETLDAFLADMPRLALPAREKLRGHDNLFLLETNGGRKVYIRLEDGLASVQEAEDEYPACIIRADEGLLLDMVCGRVSPMRALLFGKVAVQGDVKPLLRLCALL